MSQVEGLMTPPSESAAPRGDDRDASTSAARYALYWTPHPSSRWWTSWSDWLGRCADDGRVRVQPAIAGVDAQRLAALTADPRRYGLHATLKPPFRLVPACTRDELVRAVQAYCEGRIGFLMPALEVAHLGDFLALVPVQPHAPIERIESDLVRRFDRFRAPPTQAELARRRAQAPLSPREEALMERWGYPWVLDRFRFHLSITGAFRRADIALLDRVAEAARERLAGLAGEPLRFDAVSVFEEPSPGADFRQIARIPFKS